MPKRLTKEDTTATETYAKFVAEPFETGYGHTIGNSLRRVLLSSLEGAAITSIKVDGALRDSRSVDLNAGGDATVTLQGLPLTTSLVEANLSVEDKSADMLVADDQDMGPGRVCDDPRRSG